MCRCESLQWVNIPIVWTVVYQRVSRQAGFGMVDASGEGNMKSTITPSDRFFRPSKSFVLNTTIPVSVDFWHWKRGRGMECHFKGGRKDKSEYTLPELLLAMKNMREPAMEVTLCSCGVPCETPTRIFCELCEREQIAGNVVDLRGGMRHA